MAVITGVTVGDQDNLLGTVRGRSAGVNAGLSTQV